MHGPHMRHALTFRSAFVPFFSSAAARDTVISRDSWRLNASAVQPTDTRTHTRATFNTNDGERSRQELQQESVRVVQERHV